MYYVCIKQITLFLINIQQLIKDKVSFLIFKKYVHLISSSIINETKERIIETVVKEQFTRIKFRHLRSLPQLFVTLFQYRFISIDVALFIYKIIIN